MKGLWTRCWRCLLLGEVKASVPEGGQILSQHSGKQPPADISRQTHASLRVRVRGSAARLHVQRRKPQDEPAMGPRDGMGDGMEDGMDKLIHFRSSVDVNGISSRLPSCLFDTNKRKALGDIQGSASH